MPPTYIVDQENSAAPALSPFVNIRFRIFSILARPMPSGASSGLKCRFRSWSALSFDVNLIFLSFVSCARSQRSSMRPSTSTKRVIGTGSFPFSRKVRREAARRVRRERRLGGVREDAHKLGDRRDEGHRVPVVSREVPRLLLQVVREVAQGVPQLPPVFLGDPPR